jgi:hypothetical protein
VDEPEKISTIQWKMMQCLRWLLHKNQRLNPDLTLASIVDAFTRIQVFADTFYEWMKGKPFEHYTQFRNNLLLAEWFSNS